MRKVIKIFLKVTLVSLTIAMLCSCGFCTSPASHLSFNQITTVPDSNISAVSFSKTNNDEIYIGSENFLYIGSKAQWKTISQIKGYVYDIFISQEGEVFAATSEGLYVKSLKNRWKKAFKGSPGIEKSVFTVNRLGNQVLIGTSQGVLVSEDLKEWSKLQTVRAKVNDIKVSQKWAKVFIAAQDGLYKADRSLSSIERIYSVSVDEESSTGEEEETVIQSEGITALAVTDDEDILFFSHNNSILSTTINNTDIKRFPSTGLPAARITTLITGKFIQILAATESGLFIYDNENWLQLYKGLTIQEINDLALSGDGLTLLAAGQGGLFKAQFINNDTGLLKTLKSHFGNEPSIRQTQKAAIEYAEVAPDKIRSWRELAKRKALLPKVTLDADRYVTNLYHWDSGANPDVLLKGDDAVSWGVSVSWDLGELIWNDDQTSIDTRSKLMVELRQDILNEVNRIYFERRRLQFETLQKLISENKQLESELRIEELTADLDALTGGYFTNYIGQKEG